ncbi:MAG: type II toxin-antitoxin system RelE/ParE family toxin [Lentisphaeria bacterium]|nr:type II toxin-antitoxin system RelE/ParE family toxin [Lentisphaeria bacterium]
MRVFYVYGKEDNVYGIYGYVKKSQKIPISELEQARKLVRELKQARLI